MFEMKITTKICGVKLANWALNIEVRKRFGLKKCGCKNGKGHEVNKTDIRSRYRERSRLTHRDHTEEVLSEGEVKSHRNPLICMERVINVHEESKTWLQGS